MKQILRIVVILAVAAVVVGATYALGTSGAISSGMPDRSAQFTQAQSGETATGSTSSALAADRPARPEGGERGGGFSLMGAVSLLGNLAIVGAIVLLVAPLSSWLRRRTSPLVAS